MLSGAAPAEVGVENFDRREALLKCWAPPIQLLYLSMTRRSCIDPRFPSLALAGSQVPVGPAAGPAAGWMAQ